MRWCFYIKKLIKNISIFKKYILHQNIKKHLKKYINLINS